MQIVASDGQQFGSVEQVDEASSRIKCVPKGGARGGNHFIPLSWVTSVEGQTVRLNKSGHEIEQELERGVAARRA